jgi:hypothetical protein
VFAGKRKGVDSFSISVCSEADLSGGCYVELALMLGSNSHFSLLVNRRGRGRW